jgi:hypothetical protein
MLFLSMPMVRIDGYHYKLKGMLWLVDELPEGAPMFPAKAPLTPVPALRAPPPLGTQVKKIKRFLSFFNGFEHFLLVFFSSVCYNSIGYD